MAFYSSPDSILNILLLCRMFFMPGVINADDTDPSIRTIRKKRAD